jgi:hypothetical protein
MFLGMVLAAFSSMEILRCYCRMSSGAEHTAIHAILMVDAVDSIRFDTIRCDDASAVSKRNIHGNDGASILLSREEKIVRQNKNVVAPWIMLSTKLPLANGIAITKNKVNQLGRYISFVTVCKSITLLGSNCQGSGGHFILIKTPTLDMFKREARTTQIDGIVYCSFDLVL